MIDPYVLLNLTDDVDDATVKAAYLAAIRDYPPEKNPETFEAIRTAYETISTERKRLSYNLLQLTPINSETIIHSCMRSSEKKKLTDHSFREMLMEGILALVQKNVSQ